MPLESLLTNPNQAVPRSRSILSYFSNSLGKHARNMFDVAIEPEDPFRVYSPGQSVKGHVLLTVSKGFDITHLVIALHGYAKVYKHQIPPGERLPAPEGLATGKGTRGFQYHGNGVATLFQNEQVLCGSGFLKKHVYKFAFEVPFPAKSLPSTIDFERGTISYMLTATVTRPVTISPTVSRSTRIKFRDQIDIEPMSHPKSRVITLEPISKRGKVKVVKPSSSISTQNVSTAGQLTRNNTQNSTTSRSTNSIGNPPLSPAPSEDTVNTNTTTTSTQSFQLADAESPGRKQSPQTSDARSNATSSSAHTISATTELPRHGALPGDTIPLRVSINHTRDVRGMVIATIYRQARVDMHPALPLGNSEGKKRAEYEDVYPKSRTGLGGLYFANASPNSVFRKDLSQSSTMMVVNPATMTADITMSLKIPDEAFPTIANVPGGMIAFTYHVEVVIDLFGKMGETRLWPRLTTSDPVFSQAADAGNQLTSDWSHGILDTTQLRRTRGVITFEMSLVIGTQDSGRRKRLDSPAEPPTPEPLPHWPDQGGHDAFYQNGGYDGQYYDENGQPYYEGYDYDYDYGQGYDQNYYLEYPAPAPDFVAPPQPEEDLDEKSRLRRQEQLLLPSEPPPEGEASTSAIEYAPTAPVILSSPSPTRENNQQDGTTTPSTFNTTASVMSARSGDTIRPRSPAPPSIRGVDATDDKHELERRRLLEQASAPPVEDETETSSSSVAPPPLVPSAPTINEQDEYNVQTLNHDHLGSDLPQYER
ncbi:ph-response sensor protein [Exophiala xenobiotica]|nr:ph-response sensor protein [Exophiala xenobiotica]KAK5351462.1 ph-response sensor protein [Exophiala xenobiotica]KAK5376042.1 ph-response sensor protein [Exophiala xenobiotica]KAK5396299.1 ph-response sensor protein [Exophiala xenobiotica]KAK5416977.1 ph-response sensor protein [Exophiala xenobiotica]